MQEKDNMDKEEIYSKVLRAGSRTYFFDVRATKANDYYLTITESKKLTEGSGEFYYKKHKIYLYKEDFNAFKQMLDDITEFIINEKGEEVISEKHDPNFNKEKYFSSRRSEKSLDFEDL
ncbi:MAG: PUR family DNA/RNA-binding protein [Thermaurantimonas sp.]|uniref:DNA-binding protein n=1 Tax=Thermaurantimonas aggregans TaxID=2173829 RepID=A0A401XM71_9FLAO|nr:PUR family DNA/RNA-binding protein [Thermaurantimonas aggregans]MCX8147965.1 PUR family DNA/RNA-binding protein [Thermaurantimonas aggregans]GCD78096.1 DNA-binding protein [Thermaurantimonas aggregans]